MFGPTQEVALAGRVVYTAPLIALLIQTGLHGQPEFCLILRKYKLAMYTRTVAVVVVILRRHDSAGERVLNSMRGAA